MGGEAPVKYSNPVWGQCTSRLHGQVVYRKATPDYLFGGATPLMKVLPPLLSNECASSKCTGIASPALTGAASWI